MEDSSSSSESFMRKHWDGYKEFWSERLSILDNYSPSVQREKPLPLWSRSDVHEFIASDPVHGPAIMDSLYDLPCLPKLNYLAWGLLYFLFVSVFLHIHSDKISLKTAREAANFGLKGSVIGAVSTAGVAWKYSRSLHGAGLSFLAGGVFGWTLGHEIANHWYQVYKVDTMEAQVKFMEWWMKKCERRS